MRNIVLAVFAVTWLQSMGQTVVPCPGAMPMKDDKGSSYVTACVATEVRQGKKIFKAEPEAKKFIEAMEILKLGENFEIKKEAETK